MRTDVVQNDELRQFSAKYSNVIIKIDLFNMVLNLLRDIFFLYMDMQNGYNKFDVQHNHNVDIENLYKKIPQKKTRVNLCCENFLLNKSTKEIRNKQHKMWAI